MAFFYKISLKSSGKGRSGYTGRLIACLFMVVTLYACSGSDVDLAATKSPEYITATTVPKFTTQPEVATTVGDPPGDLTSLKVETVEPQGESNAIITVWHGLDEAGSLALKEIISFYQLLKPGTQINLIYIPTDDLYNRYIKEVSSNLGPSIMLGSGEWGPVLYDLGVISTLENQLSPEMELNLSPPALVASSYRDSIISLPFSISGAVLYRNSSIIPEPPATIIDLVSLSQAESKGRVVGAYLEVGTLFSMPQLTACGGSLMDLDGFPSFGGQIGLCWFELLRIFQVAGPTSFNSDDDLSRFKASRVGMIFDGTWQSSSLFEQLGESLVIDPWPAYKEEHLSGYVWTKSLFMNPNLSEIDKKNSVAFLEYLLTPGTQTILAQIGLIPSILNLEPEDPLISQAMVALSGGTAFPGNPEMMYYWQPLNSALRSVLVEDANPEEVLLTVTKKITQDILNGLNSGTTD